MTAGVSYQEDHAPSPAPGSPRTAWRGWGWEGAPQMAVGCPQSNKHAHKQTRVESSRTPHGMSVLVGLLDPLPLPAAGPAPATCPTAPGRGPIAFTITPAKCSRGEPFSWLPAGNPGAGHPTAPPQAHAGRVGLKVGVQDQSRQWLTLSPHPMCLTHERLQHAFLRLVEPCRLQGNTAPNKEGQQP